MRVGGYELHVEQGEQSGQRKPRQVILPRRLISPCQLR